MVFLSIEEVSIPKLGKIFRVPKIFEVSNSLVSRIENFFQICDITTSCDLVKPGPNFSNESYFLLVRLADTKEWPTVDYRANRRVKEIKSKPVVVDRYRREGERGERESAKFL